MIFEILKKTGSQWMFPFNVKRVKRLVPVTLTSFKKRSGNFVFKRMNIFKRKLDFCNPK